MKDCACPQGLIDRYASRLSGPLIDRIDLTVEVGRVAVEELEKPRGPATTPDMRAAVTRARARQRSRYRRSPTWLNAHAPDALLREVAAPDEAGRALLEKAVDRFALTPRGYMRVLRVARTIADLADDETLPTAALAEALQFRIAETGPLP